jgi:hypothetical protein
MGWGAALSCWCPKNFSLKSFCLPDMHSRQQLTEYAMGSCALADVSWAAIW